MDQISQWLFQYYMTDWLAVGFMCIYLWRVADKHRDAFVWGAMSSAFFVILNTLIESPPGIAFNALFLLLHGRAYMRWKNAPDNSNSPAGSDD